MRENDNWGWRARIGMFIVGNEAIPEAEWWSMVPSGVSVHAARVTSPTPWATWDAERQHVALQPDVVRGAEQFAAMRLSSVVIGHSSSSIAGGKGWDEAVVEALGNVLPADVAVTTNGLDCLAALRHMEVRRPFVVLPPWYGEGLIPAAEEYLRDHELDPVTPYRHDPGRKWRDIPPEELYANGAGFDQDVEALYTSVRDRCPREADGVLIAGTGFRCVAVINALEEDLGRPVVAANQASLWRCLRMVGVNAKIPGYGKLLEQ